jgi:uncharacterized protein (TIGR00297 family)
MEDKPALDPVPDAQPWPKAIPPARDRLQSRFLVWTVMPLLLAAAIAPAVRTLSFGGPIRPLLLALLLSLAFAAIVWLLRSAPLGAAGVGFLICMVLAESPTIVQEIRALITLFLLTFAATRFGRTRKEYRGLAEARAGRRASQVIANLGAAALCASFDSYFSFITGFACIAALAEATADTMSSEIGQAIGGPAFLITNFRRVPPGTDGAISLVGTTTGVLGAAAIIYIGFPSAAWFIKAPLLAASAAGLFFDSLLGATLERRGWIGNDLVNFASTTLTAAIAVALLLRLN